MLALRLARALALPDSWIAAGAVRNLVWDHLHQSIPGHTVSHPTDVDLVYFAPDEPPLAQQRHQQQLTALAPHLIWDVVNQAHVHRWYRHPDGHPITPLNSTAQGIATWPETATCVGLRLDDNNQLHVLAPLGLHDLFALHLRHNPTRVPLRVAQERMHRKGWCQRWPLLAPMGALRNAPAAVSSPEPPH